MTYEEFKKELYRNVLEQEQIKRRKVKVRLYEKRNLYTDEEDVRTITALNLSYYGKADLEVQEDVVCAFWRDRNRTKVLKWWVRPLYERFKVEGWTGVLPEIVMKILMVNMSYRKKASEKESYEYYSDRLIIRPVNYAGKSKELADSIYWRYDDIALVLHAIVCEERGHYITVMIQQDTRDKWEISDQQLLTNALMNSAQKMPPRLFHATDMRTRCAFTDGVFMEGEKGKATTIHKWSKRDGLRGYRLTTSRQASGAVAIFYPGVQERLAELLGEDYFVGFTSIHEAIIHPASSKQHIEMKKAIQHINAVFDEQDMLSNNVYRYCCSRGALIEV